jgi:hypothetical protein
MRINKWLPIVIGMTLASLWGFEAAETAQADSVRLMNIRSVHSCLPGFSGVDYLVEAKRFRAIQYKDKNRKTIKDSTVDPSALQRLVAAWDTAAPKVSRTPKKNYCGYRLTVNGAGSPARSFDWKDSDAAIPKSIADIEAEMNRLFALP